MRSKKVAVFGMLAAVAIVLSILENSVMSLMNLAVPGVKPGLANIAVLLALYYLGGGAAWAIALIKSTAVFLATGAITTLWFSLGGAVLSMAGMLIVNRIKVFSLAGVSAAGGFLNNAGQLAVMALIGGSTGFFWYLPVLTVFGVGFGLLMGVLANMIVRRVPKSAVLGTQAINGRR